MRICPNCRSYYADTSAAFCLADGTPLIKVDPRSKDWSEGTRAIEEKAKRLSQQRGILKWRRIVLGVMTALILITVSIKSFTVETTTPPKPGYKISGQVMANKPLGSVRITLEGAKTASTTTDDGGRYAFSDVPAGASYTVIPGGQLEFKPSRRSVDNLQRDESADFKVETYKISGRVTSADQPRSGVTLMLEGRGTTSTIMDNNHYYAFPDLLAGASYTITPKGQMKFKPPRRYFDKLRQDESADFIVDLPPPPKCSEVDKGREKEAILGILKPIIERDQRATLTVRPQAGRFANNLGQLKDGAWYFQGCTAGVRIRYQVWRPDPVDKLETTSKERTFRCTKAGDKWSCKGFP